MFGVAVAFISNMLSCIGPLMGEGSALSQCSLAREILGLDEGSAPREELVPLLAGKHPIDTENKG